MLATAIELMERGYVPDWLTRVGIRRLLAERLRGAEHAAVRARLEAELRAVLGDFIPEGSISVTIPATGHQ